MSVVDRGKAATGRRWEARCRVAGQHLRRRFDTKLQAQSWVARMTLAPPERMAAARRKVTVDEIVSTWLASKRDLRPTTRQNYRRAVDEVLSQFAGRLAASVTPGEVRQWAARDRGVSYRRKSLWVLGSAYQMAMGDGLLEHSPCVGVRGPRDVESDRRALSWEQLEALADQAGGYGPMVWLMGTVGLRIGEAVGLQVGDVDARAGRIHVARSVVATDAGPVLGPPKGGKVRDVAVPDRVLAMLPLSGRKRSEWLFTSPHGQRLDAHNWRTRVLAAAAERAGLGHVEPHELRHTAASLMIQSGAVVSDVSRNLGHANEFITLRVYNHLFERGIDDVARRMNERLMPVG